jgi:Global regulator protein family
MPLKLSLRVGESVAIGGPTTMRVEAKSGQVVGLVFDADRSVPIRIIPEREDTSARKPQGAPVGLGQDRRSDPPPPGLGRKS